MGGGESKERRRPTNEEFEQEAKDVVHVSVDVVQRFSPVSFLFFSSFS